MIRFALFASGALAAFAGAATIGADADSAIPCTAEMPGCAVVPGMQDGLTGHPCPSWTQFTFGYGPPGHVLMCTSFDGGNTGTWWGPDGSSVQLVGVRDIGAPCRGGQMDPTTNAANSRAFALAPDATKSTERQ